MKLTKMTFRFVVPMVLLSVMLAIHSATVSANSTTVVQPNDVGTSWLLNDTRAGGDVDFVQGPGTPPLGIGSLEMTTTDTAGGSSQAKAQLFNYQYGSFGTQGAGVALADINAISYWAYRASSSTNSAAQTISLNIEVDYAGDGSSFATLVFEPTYNGYQGAMLTDTWQEWDAYDGGNAIWWSTKAIPGVCAFNCFVSWSSILANNPNAEIKFGVGFNVGSGWVGDFTGFADALTLGVSGQSDIYDFEPDSEGPITTDVMADPVAVSSQATVTAIVDDSSSGGSDISGAEYSSNGGAWTPMTAADSSFDSPTESVTASFTAPATAGVYTVCVRGSDAAGNTGAEACTMLAVYDPDGGFVTGGGWINSPVGAYNVPTLVWDQGFETDTSGWFDSSSGWYGTVNQVASGTGGISSSSGSSHAVMSSDGSSAPFSRFDEYRDAWTGSWTAEIDVYLDPAWSAGSGFDYSVAATGSDGNHQRDYIFHVTKDTSTGLLLVAGSNNTNFAPREDLETINHYQVTTAGWYTLQHLFYDAGGYLAVDLNLLDVNGNVLFTETRSNTADTIPGEVGGNRYSWFTFINVSGGIAMDEHQLKVLISPAGKANFGFVSKYKKGASTPTGSAEFVFQMVDLNFHSNVQEWLVVTGSNYARFKGEGTINGQNAPNGQAYKFMIWAGDGTGGNGEDTFRIKIWWEDNSTETIVYDNGMDQAIGGGSIVVHTGKK